MALLICQDCGNTTENTKKWAEEHECDCGGSYAVKGSEDDDYEPNECEQCGKDINQVGEGNSFSCDECSTDNICEECVVKELEHVILCRKCLNKCPIKIIEKEKIVEKIIEVPKETIRVMGFSEPIL